MLVRTKLRETLMQHDFNVIEATSGQEALDILSENKKIDLVITDHEMDAMDGIELTKRIRRLYPMEELPIIALTGSANETLIARYLKSEANDFIKKPYSQEELRCRVSTALSLKDMFENIKMIAITDRLTSLYNRFHLYEKGHYLAEMNKRDNSSFSLAIFDIDHFKKINDTYGHTAGDHTLVEFSSILKKAFRKTDLVARFGGEEFVVIMPNTPLEQAAKVCNAIREKVAQYAITVSDDTKVSFTVSVGVSHLGSEDTLESLIQKTDKLLYKAKESGRNKVISGSYVL
jgi:diguanylate cyclase (GGDEF)-like protein